MDRDSIRFETAICSLFQFEILDPLIWMVSIGGSVMFVHDSQNWICEFAFDALNHVS